MIAASTAAEPWFIYADHQWPDRAHRQQALPPPAYHQLLGRDICRYCHRPGKLLSKRNIGGRDHKMSIYNYLTLGSMLLMTFLILIQTRGASLGAGLGGAGEVNTTRRGTDKTIFQLTIVCALVFSLSLIFGVIVK